MPFFGDDDLEANSSPDVTSGRSSIRELPLLEGERLQEKFGPYHGLGGQTTEKGSLLVLTNQRVISFLRDDGHKETYMAALDELKGVSVKAAPRGMKNLIQGFAFILFGILAYFIIGYITNSVWSEISIASALGAAVVFVGLLYIARYFFWEQEGTIVFQGGTWERSDKAGGTEAYTWELSFPFKNNKASADVYNLVNRFFEIKRHNGATQFSPPATTQEEPSVPPATLPLLFRDQNQESVPTEQLPLLQQEDSGSFFTTAPPSWTWPGQDPTPAPPTRYEEPAVSSSAYATAPPEEPQDPYNPYLPPSDEGPAAPSFGYPFTPPEEPLKDPTQPYLSPADEGPAPPVFGFPSTIRLDQPRGSFEPYRPRGAAPEPPAETAPPGPEDLGGMGLTPESDSPAQLEAPIPRIYRAIKEWWNRPAS